MLREDCKVGMEVIFGRPNGEKSRGVVRKCNPMKAKVELLEDRGRGGRGGTPGAIWIVPYSMMEPVGEGGGDEIQTVQYSRWQDTSDQYLLEAMYHLYGQLSPENLTCDGELPASQVRVKAAALRRKLEGCFQAYGCRVSEEAVYEWHRQREADRKSRQ